MSLAIFNKRSFHAIFLLLLIAALYWRMLSYPYIQDDWHHLHYFYSTEERSTFLDYCRAFFTVPEDSSFYRPLAKLYFYFIFKQFGDDPTGFRVLNLFVLFCAALVIQRIGNHLLKDEFLGWMAAASFALSSTVLMDPLMWMVGMYDIGGSFFFLLSILLFLKGRHWLSAASYVAAIMFKEGSLLLPFILLAYSALIERNFLFRKVLPHIVVFLIVFALRLRLLFVGALLHQTNAYYVDVFGSHLLTNSAKYIVWTLEGLSGLANLHQNKMNAVIILAAALGISVFASRKKLAVFSERASLKSFLIVWATVCLLPALVLPNHAYRYYLIYSYPAIIFLFVLLLNYFSKRWVLISFLVLFFIFNSLTLHVTFTNGLRAPRLSGSNVLPQRGMTVKMMLSYVQNELKNPPRGSVFVFDGVNDTRPFQGIDPVSFQRRNFLRFVYRDPSIDAMDLRGDIFSNAKRKLNLTPDKTIVLGLSGGKIKRYHYDDLFNTQSAFYTDPKW